jgi:hypothetical protein
MAKPQPIRAQQVQSVVEHVFGEPLHAKQVESLSNAALGVIHSAALNIHSIGAGMAGSRGVQPRHAVKQVDRLLSNHRVCIWNLFAHWVPFVVGARKEIFAVLDWTDFDNDDQTTIALHMLTSHGRATPLMWSTVKKSDLKDRRNEFEDDLLERFREVLAKDVKVTIMADRGFGDQKLYQLLTELGFDYIIRFRDVITVTDEHGESRPAAEWVPSNHRALMLKTARVTQDRYAVPAVVVVKDASMKEPWCLATSHAEVAARGIVKHYGRRFTIEESFRDGKDIHFGMGLSWTHVSHCMRRDRLLLLSAMAIVLLTILGAAGEQLGLDRWLRVNTVKRRTHSLFRQGQMYYALLPTMKEPFASQLAERFDQLVAEQPHCCEILGLI